MDDTAVADPNDPSELVNQLMNAGLYGPQMDQFKKRLGLGQQWMQPETAQGHNVGSTYVAASPLEHASNMVRQILGAKMAGSALKSEKDLTAQLGSTRSKFAQALTDASAPVQAPPDLLAAPGFDQASQEKAKQGLLQKLQIAGLSSGDPQIASAVHAVPDMALKQQQLASGLLQQALEKQRLAAGGPQEALGGQTPGVFEALTKRENVPKFAATYPGAQIYDQKTGRTVPGSGAPQGLLDPAALDQAAELYHATGTLPAGVMRGPAGATIGRQIANRAAELHPNANLAGNKAGYGADTGALKKLQAQADSMDAFENTALANLKMFREQAKGVVDTGSPLFNMPARKFMQAVAGDPKMTAFNVSRQVAVQEISKVLGGATGAAAVSDSARHEVEGLIGPDASLAQISKAGDILEADMANRRAATHGQLAQIHDRMSGKKGAEAAAPPAAAGPAPAAPAHPQDPIAVQWAKAHPQDPRAAAILKANGVTP